MSLASRVVPALRRRGLERGVLGTSRGWMAVWATITTVRLVRRFTARREVVARFELRPGETIQVSDLGVEAG